jgi:hypothetical protein
LPLEQQGQLRVANGEVALPLRIAGIACGEALTDVKGVAIGLERIVELALIRQYVADLLVRDRQVVFSNASSANMARPGASG